MGWHKATALEELEQDAPTGVRIGTTALVLVRRGDDVHAVDALCPHKFTAMEDAHMEGDCIVCPTHDGGFDVTTGACRPGDEWAGRLGVHPTRIEDGDVFVEL